MHKFHVIRKEVHDQVVAIEADDEQSAIDKVADGEGDEVGEAEYNRTMPSNVWGCEKINEQ